MTNPSWTRGHILTEDEVEELYESVRLERVFVVSPQPAPGVAFSAPEGEVGIYRSKDGSFFEVLDSSDEQPESVCFIGRNLSQEEAAQAALDFIQNENYETPVAIFFHLDKSKFDPDDDMIAALSEFFWVRSSWLKPEVTKVINDKLLATNGYYKTLVQFLNDPSLPKFEMLRKQVTTLMDFSGVYYTTN